jgi:pantoate--beta-alanine ligase
LVRAWKRWGERVALVPTMGALHQGHLALVRLAAARADRVVASVFVNPTQFGAGEDFERYPRRPREDTALLGENGCDLVFLPEIATIYPAGSVTYVDLAGADPAPGHARSPAQGMEGTSRPGHFRGVATVVAKLFNLVEPDVAIFGEKDAQQLAVVRRMVKDLHFSVEIVAHPTVREDDGLAMSSRNAYLSAEERAAAGRIYRTLRAAARRIEAGERDPQVIRRLLRERLAAEPLFDLDYAEVVAPETFEPVTRIESDVVLPVAVRVGRTRLLDNVTVKLRT